MAGGPGQVYLVTGGCGFLGKHLVKLLVEQEDRVSEIRVFDRKVDREMESLSTDAVRVTLVAGDITEMDSVREAARGVDLIIHNAALVDVWGKYCPSTIWDINYQGTWNVLEACKELGIQYLVYTSTMETVGPNINRDHFIRGNEETQYNIMNVGPYADSKAQAEKLVLRANGTKLQDGRVLVTCALRPTGVYGENNSVMEQLLHVLIKYGRRRLRMAGKHIEHSRVYVGNVAWMHVQAARALQLRPEVLGGEAYFCYDDSPYLSYEEFDMELMGPIGIRMVGQVPPLPYFILYLLASFLEVVQWLMRPLVSTAPSLNRYTLAMVTTAFTVQTDKATRHFGYQPLVSWQQSKARTVAWIKEVDRAYSQKK